MPRGGARVGAGRKPKAKLPPGDQAPVSTASTDGLLPLDYMLQVIRDPKIDASRRDRMAVAAAPYLHPKVGESGKKEQKGEAAKVAATGLLRPQKVPPKLVVSNG